MLYIGYQYKSSMGMTINKLVVCENENEYRQMRTKIEDAGYELIEFREAYRAKTVLK